MLRIRLQRRGRRNQPSFRLVVADRAASVKGKFIDDIGFINPLTKERKVDVEKARAWIQRGAQPSATVHNLLVDAGAIVGPKVRAWRPKPRTAGEGETPSAVDKGASAPADSGDVEKAEKTDAEETQETEGVVEREAEETKTPEEPNNGKESEKTAESQDLDSKQ